MQVFRSLQCTTVIDVDYSASVVWIANLNLNRLQPDPPLSPPSFHALTLVTWPPHALPSTSYRWPRLSAVFHRKFLGHDTVPLAACISFYNSPIHPFISVVKMCTESWTWVGWTRQQRLRWPLAQLLLARLFWPATIGQTTLKYESILLDHEVWVINSFECFWSVVFGRKTSLHTP